MLEYRFIGNLNCTAMSLSWPTNSADDKELAVWNNMYEDENAKAEAHYAQGNYEEALSAWEKADGAVPCSFALCFQKGIALRKLGRYDEAAAALEKALQLEPKNADAWRAHAWSAASWIEMLRRWRPVKSPWPSIHTMPEPG